MVNENRRSGRVVRCLGSLGFLVCLTVGMAACGSESADRRNEATDTLTRRQKDSLISTMPIPGARAVGKALDAADAASARARQHDSLLGADTIRR